MSYAKEKREGAHDSPHEATPQRVQPHGLAHLANDLRLACMRISRRVRFESTDAVAPHQFSVLSRLAEEPRTPRELAGIEKVSAPSMTRTRPPSSSAAWSRARTTRPTDDRSSSR